VIMMISEIALENFALFRSARVGLQPGLNVLSGESGSGKSLALESIVALFGGRLAQERIGPWQDQVRVRAILQLDPGDWRWQPLAELGVEPDSVLIVERSTGKDGHTVYRAQGQPVPAQAVRQLADGLLQYVGQNQLQKTFSSGFIRQWLDDYGALGELVAQVQSAYREFMDWNRQVEQLQERAADLPTLEEKRVLRDELQALKLTVGEDEALAAELGRLRAGRTLVETGQRLYARLDGSGSGDGLLADVDAVLKLAEVLARYDSTLENTVDEIRAAAHALGDARLEVSGWLDRLDLDPQKLEQLEVRADQISRVKRRFGPELTDILKFLKELEGDIERLENWDWKLTQLRRQQGEAQARLRILCDRLSDARCRLLVPAGEELTACIREMEMPTGTIAIERQQGPVSEFGTDVLDLLFSASAGQPPKSLGKVASGGELARVALALAVTGQTQDNLIYVFDEIDQGLGGASADRVAQLLQRLGQMHQVLVVSHQAVVAARAHHHLRVYKRVDNGRSMAVVETLAGAARSGEVARMLSGSQDGVAMRHAERLLAEGSGNG
jgi:DNA repair protein RecN (Recombination protein N)